MDALPIPKPQVLDPDRLLRDDREHQFTQDHRARAEVLDIALHESCAYAQQLWDDLDAVRQYLLDSLPPDPHTSTDPVHAGASPTGPEDEQGWQKWTTAFAAVTSVLCGPHGDSGFGMSRARQEAQRRRTVPPHLAVATSSLNAVPESAEPIPRSGIEGPQPPQPAAQEQDPPTGTLRHQHTVARTVGLAVLSVLALRGLRPRRGSHIG